jgi:hypothetical protein
MKKNLWWLGLMFLPTLLIVWSCNKITTPASPTNSGAGSANSSHFVLACGATLPSSANSSSITLMCGSAVDLSSMQSANSTNIYACVNPSNMPKSFNSSNVFTGASYCSAPTTTCAGPSACSGSLNSSNITVNCGGTLPCSANSATITITCATITDLSSIQSANSTIIYMHNAPCKLPQSFNSSQIILY